ncbi:MAG: pyridoxamine 5'-phosphate oxidase [Solirubrobacterales bacterium]|nr:pyridoxamine 5'-phosphate oxidase [Solirubrobacterales bacterium]
MTGESEHAQPLRRADAEEDPSRQFGAWFAEASAAAIRLPEAAALATASAEGAPSVRMVLVKDYADDRFVFYSNHSSRKGRELAANPRAALLFHWDVLGRQVRIEGPVARVDAQETAAYVRSRPRGSQIGALASPQSQVVESREELERFVAELGARLGEGEPPLPSGWGGFALSAETYEFWQQRADRLHDRLRYRREQGRWVIERLAP